MKFKNNLLILMIITSLFLISGCIADEPNNLESKLNSAELSVDYNTNYYEYLGKHSIHKRNISYIVMNEEIKSFDSFSLFSPGTGKPTREECTQNSITETCECEITNMQTEEIKFENCIGYQNISVEELLTKKDVLELIKESTPSNNYTYTEDCFSNEFEKICFEQKDLSYYFIDKSAQGYLNIKSWTFVN